MGCIKFPALHESILQIKHLIDESFFSWSMQKSLNPPPVVHPRRTAFNSDPSGAISEIN